jgi:hypothetical protein
MAYGPSTSYGQCLCSGGDPATPLTYYYKLDTTDVPTATISFPKFNPSVGILSCVTLDDTLSLVSNSNVINEASVAVTYRFLLSVNNDIDGPGISINESATRNYGPTLLSRFGDPLDRTVYGPDTLFKKSIHQTSSSSVVSYLGTTGNVNFTYTMNGGLISTQGGINYSYQIVSKYWGGFRLIYYWCPNMLLSTNIKNFSAFRKDNNVLLKWATENNISGVAYEIEYSENGRDFRRIGALDPNSFTGTHAQYEYKYDPTGSTSPKLYFRIRQHDASGKSQYSAIRTVIMSEDSPAGFVIYPNPVSRQVSMQFDRTMNGNYLVEITNLAGQVIFNRNVRLNNNNNMQFELSNPPNSGIYYLKITDTKTRLSYSSKLLIKR